MTEPAKSPEWVTPPQQQDSVPLLKVTVAATAVLAVFAAGTVIVYFMGTARQEKLNPTGPSIPARLGQAEINEVNQAQFMIDTRAYLLEDEKAARLDRYGWVDRERGIIHIPVERAIDQIVAEEQQAPPSDGGNP